MDETQISFVSTKMVAFTLSSERRFSRKLHHRVSWGRRDDSTADASPGFEKELYEQKLHDIHGWVANRKSPQTKTEIIRLWKVSTSFHLSMGQFLILVAESEFSWTEIRSGHRNKRENTSSIVPYFITLFLDAPSHLYKRVCPSVGPSVRPSGTPSLRRLLGASYAEYSALFFSKFAKN